MSRQEPDFESAHSGAPKRAGAAHGAGRALLCMMGQHEEDSGDLERRQLNDRLTRFLIRTEETIITC